MERPIVSGMEGIGLSPNLWRNCPLDQILAGNDLGYGFGLFDNFLKFPSTSLYDGYIRLSSAGCSIAPISSEADAPGIARLLIDGNAANDEAVLQLGNGVDVGAFKFAYDLWFEARIRPSVITASKWSWFVGMATGGAAGAAITDLLFADASGSANALYATNSFVGFQHLTAEGAAVDGMYQKSGETKVDGAVNTSLDSIASVEAAKWIKLGLRYQQYPSRKLTWYVNGVKKASIGKSALDAAAFPDDVFLQPTIGIKDSVGTAINLDIDWWGVAGLIPNTTSVTP